jgi:hypothetical protein
VPEIQTTVACAANPVGTCTRRSGKGPPQRVPRALPPETFSSTPLAEHANSNNRAASAKDRNERNCPDGIAEQCRSDSHAHSHDEHDCGWNDGNEPVHGAP